jgi:uncharacterized protein with FMN-binding domain
LLWTNISFAWTALILSFLLSVIWILRLTIKNRRPRFLYDINRTLRKHHKLIGITLIAAGLAHGLLSGESVLSLNLGTATWSVSILLCISWIIRNRFKVKRAWIVCHRILTLAFTALIALHIISVGGFLIDDLISGNISQPQIAAIDINAETVSSAPSADPAKTYTIPKPSPEQPAQSQAPSETASVYKDGAYEGTAAGYRPGIVVEVVIEGGKIISVTVIDHNEKGEQHWGAPVRLIPQAIVEAQSANVDSISGATKTSNGIKKAVNDALSKALL